MKVTSVLFALIIGLTACNSDQNNDPEPITKTGNAKMVFDSLKAKEYGADPYGMKRYVMAFLKNNPEVALDSAESIKLQRAHLNNIMKLAEEGKLIVAGPFLDKGATRGIYIFDVETVEEAEKLTATDPAIKAGSLVMELRPWYGSAALIEVNSIHKTIASASIVE